MKSATAIRSPKEHEVKITVSRTSRIKCVPYKVKVKRQDHIEWVCEDGPFVLQMLKKLQGGVQHKHSLGATPALAAAKISKQAKKGHYKYAVAVEKGGVVYIDALCPEIIID